jgi:hypothetical protein
VGRIAAAVVLLVLSVATSFKPELLNFIAAFAAFGAVVAVAGAGAALGLSKLAKRAPQSVQPMLLGLGITLGAACLMFFYVNWAATVGAYQDTMDDAWRGQGWGEHAIAWHYVRAETPPDATIAFANTAYIYPLYGFDYTRRVVYAPVRPEIHRFVDVPRLGDTVPGDLILDAMTAAQNANADRATWLANLQRLGADFVVIYKHDRSKDPPELRFATELPEKFKRVFEDPNAIIYRVEK